MVSSYPEDHNTDGVTVVTDSFDGERPQSFFTYGWSGAPSDRLRDLTDYVWAEYCYRQNHASVRVIAPEAETLTAKSTYIYTVEPAWQHYRVELVADGRALDLNKTLAEQELSGFVRVRYTREQGMAAQ